MTKHLWETDHPYYMTEGCFYTNDAHTECESFAAFLDEMGDADEDYNWLIRWDWIVGKGEDENGVSDGEHQLRLQFLAQRKAYPFSFFVKVVPDEEPVIIEYLTKYWEYMKKMWEPFA